MRLPLSGASNPTCLTAKKGVSGALSRLGYMITKWKVSVSKSASMMDAEAALYSIWKNSL